MAVSKNATVEAVQRAACARWGAADASVVRYVDRQTEIRTGEAGEDRLATGGVWHLLSVRRHAGGKWELVSRRRTLGELLAMVETRRAA